MHGRNEETGAERQVARSIGLIVLAVALLFAVEAGEPLAATQAGFFDSPILDLTLDGPRGVNGFVGGPNVAPGDRLAGVLVLHNEGGGSRDLLDLDLDLHLESLPQRARDLHVVELRYDGDDLLTARDGGRDVLAEIDANPVLGDGDGRLGLRELEAGVNDLPAPRGRADGGSAFHLALELDPAAREQGVELARFHVIFALSDRANGDLN